MVTDSRTVGRECFIICPIGDDGSATRARSDKVLRHIVLPATKQCGYSEEAIIRADKMPRPGVITSQIIQYLVQAELVIADLTDHNPNVFYELAVRHAMKKPVVQLIQVGQRIPFDIAQMRTIIYDLGDPDNVVVSRDQLSEQIRAVEENPTDSDNPISSGIQLQNLLRIDNPLAKSHAEIITMLQDLRSVMINVVTNKDREIRDTSVKRKREIQFVEPEFVLNATVIEEDEDSKDAHTA